MKKLNKNKLNYDVIIVMIVYLCCKYNAFMLYIHFITKVIILKMLIHTLLVLTHHINILTTFIPYIEII